MMRVKGEEFLKNHLLQDIFWSAVVLSLAFFSSNAHKTKFATNIFNLTKEIYSF